MNRHKKSSASHKRSLLFGILARSYSDKTGKWKFKVNWIRLGIALLALAALTWIGASCAIYIGYKNLRGYKDISFINVLKMPFNLDEHRKNLGEYNIKLAKEYLKNEDFYNGILNLRVGLIRSPHNIQARLTLARLVLLLYKNTEDSAQILSFGIPDAYRQRNSDYLIFTCAVYSAIDEKREESIKLLNLLFEDGLANRSSIMKLASSMTSKLGKERSVDEIVKMHEYASKHVKDPDIKKFFAQNAAIALGARGDFKGAFKVLSDANINSGETYSKIRAFEYWNNGDTINAIKIMKFLSTHSRNPSEIYRVLSKYYGELGMTDKSEGAFKMSLLTNKDTYSPSLVSIYDKLADKNLSIKDVSAYMQTFGKVQQAVNALASLGIKFMNADIINALPMPKIDKDAPLPPSASNMLFKLEYAIISQDSNTANSILKQMELFGNKFESSTNGFALAINAMSGADIEKDLNKFAEENADTPENILALGHLFLRAKLVRETLLTANLLSQKFPDAYNVPAFCAEAYFAREDIPSLAKIVANSKARIPYKIMSSLNGKLDSDSFIMTLSPNEQKSAKEKLEKANTMRRQVEKLP